MTSRKGETLVSFRIFIRFHFFWNKTGLVNKVIKIILQILWFRTEAVTDTHDGSLTALKHGQCRVSELYFYTGWWSKQIILLSINSNWHRGWQELPPCPLHYLTWGCSLFLNNLKATFLCRILHKMQLMKEPTFSHHNPDLLGWLFCSPVWESPQILFWCLPHPCSALILGFCQENNLPSVIGPECYLLFISGSNSVPMSPQVPAACPVPSRTETPWKNSSWRGLDVGHPNSVLSCNFELEFTYLLSNDGKFNPQTALLTFKINV